MYRNFFLITILACLPGCLNTDTKCCEFVGSNPISKGLYLERYKTYCAGVFGELTQCYLTDSTSFRKNIGSYDEHENFFARLHGNKIDAYNFRSTFISDTIERKTITKADLWANHHTAVNCLALSPVFGKNTITCDNNFYPASSYKTEDGYFLVQVQYKCGTDYSNAVFYTDSSNFCVFIGVYTPGSFQNNYRVKQDVHNAFNFYNIEEKRKVDTVKAESYILADLKKEGLTKVCN
jgi:hypothetical protein